MTRPMRWLHALLLFTLTLPLLAVAQERGLEIDIVGGNASALPIAVVPFAGSAGETDLAAVIRAGCRTAIKISEKL